MEIGHSTLLKFFVKDKPKMEKHTLKIENLSPSDIESEVPRQQKLREDTAPIFDENKTELNKNESTRNVSDGKLTLKQGDTVETYAPVITVKTVESNFGKDGLKYQKKTVTEDISVHFQHLFKKEVKPGKTVVTQEGQIEWVDLRDMIKKPIYMGLQEEVIRTQHIRPSKDGDKPPTDKTEKPSPEDNKPQTRIPVSRFKPVAQRVLKERRDATDIDKEKSKKEPPEKPRRTSIPKLKDRITIAKKSPQIDDSQPASVESHPVEAKDKTPVKLKRATRSDKIPVMSKDHYKITKKDERVTKDIKSETEDTSEEQPSVINERVEPAKTESNEKLDDDFDKLYEETLDNDAVSLPDDVLDTKIKDPEKLESKFEEIVHQYDDPPIEQVNIEPIDKARYSKIPLLRRRSSHDVNVPGQFDRRLSLKTGTVNKATLLSDQKANDSTVTKNDYEKQNNIGGDIAHKYEDTDKAQDESIIEINNNDEINEDPYIETLSPDPLPDYNTIATPDSELVKVGIFGITTRDIPLEETKQNVATPELETVRVAVIDIPAKEPTERINENIELVEAKPDRLPIIQDDTYKLPVDQLEIEHKQHIDKTYLTEQEVTKDFEKAEKDISNEAILMVEPSVHNKINHINAPQQNISIDNPDNELKSYNLIKNTNNIEERTKSRYINRPPKDKVKSNNEAKSEDDMPIVKGKVSRILRRLTSQEVPNDNSATNNITDKEVEDVKKQMDDIPKKKSVLSKIAMFERGDAEPPLPKKTTHKYAKPIRTISEDLKHSPKIVQEVLKPKGVETDKHTIVTVDIVRPVEVITNNEEQVPVVENLKETTVIYDNFDAARQNKIEIETKNVIIQDVLPPKGVHTDKHTIVTIDILKPVEVMNNEEQVTVVENFKETKVTYDNFDADRQNKIEIESKNLLIQDVLPPKGVHTDKNTIVTVDILKPVEITNNEEQVTVVENLKETTVTYDNVDHDILNEIEPIEFEPESLNIVNNDSLLTDNSTNFDNHNKYDKFEDKYSGANADEYKHEHKTKEKWKSTDALAEYLPVKEKINRLKSCEETNLKKAKSTAELDLGDSVKGKVKKLIVRMNSFELLDDVKPKEVEVISAKERPRKRSVSEKIALFERKLTPVTMDNIKVESSARSLNLHTKPIKENVNVIPAVKDNSVNLTNDAAKIKELTNAKLTFGSVSNMSYIELRDGRKMPVLALGTALLDPKLATHIVAAAIDLGYRAIDTAFIYGNEREVGEGIRAKIQDGTVRREDLFIMNKIWSTFHRPDLVEGACRASLAATGLDYFDLYMIHNPMSFKEGGDPIPKIANVLQFSSFDYLDAWFAMEQLVAKGLVRSIGVSNFNSVQLARVLEKGRIKPVVNQVECHPYLSQQRLSDFCSARDVRLSCFGVLGSKGTPPDLKASQASAIDDPLVQVLAAGLEISPAQLLIRYQIDSGHAVVVKGSSAAHLWDNLRALNVTLDAPQVAAIHALNKNKRTFTFVGMGDTHKNYPFKIAF